MKRSFVALMATLSLTAGAVNAEEMASMHEGAKPKAWYEKVKASCWIDTYYQYNFNGRHNAAPTGRIFDNKQEEFVLNGAQLSMSSADEATGVSGQMDLLYGPIAAIVQPALPASSILIKQAFLAETFGPLTVKLGKFVTYLGTEVIDTPANLNYSRNQLFGQVPYYHVGLLASYTVMDGLGASFYTGNGNSVDSPSSEDRDWGAQIAFSGVKGLSSYFNYYNEIARNAGAGSPVQGTLHYFNLLGSFQVADSLGVSAEYLYKTRIANGEKNTAGNLITTSTMTDPSTGNAVVFSPKWQGYALYLNYATPIANLSVIPRYSQWWTEGSSTPGDDLTLTAKYVTGALAHNLEFRTDSTAPAIFAGAGGVTELQYRQNTLTYGATFSF